ncbi:hypothetical protein [Herbiconiux ginsengi]|uniref:Protein kinase domain-containing protein n=1 Tax=Herbiconiux ginsengi TaxID=381665 RepID=A0A1H3PN21_9MICO|nr:hypothetical protein [Herbiconiux ginsengi]SDZ02652.1 hypothetical protein SAMN05216554_2000 [Herbiconiux ginsengi]
MTLGTSPPALSALGPAVAGYRLHELIGVGESANVYAGVLDVGDGGADVAGSDPVAVKLCLTSGADPVAGEFGRETECRVLALRPIAAMPRLLDLGTTERGELVMVMTLCRGRPGSSPVPRAGRPAVDPGELSRLVDELHEAGVAHGGLDADAVLVGDDGDHSLVGFRSARFAGEAGFDALVGDDLRAVAVFTRGRGIVAFSRRSWTGGEVELRDPVVTPRAGRQDSPGEGSASHDSGSSTSGLDEAWRWTDGAVEEPGHELAFLETVEPAVLALRESAAALRGLVRRRSAGAMAPRRRRILAAAGVLVVAAAVAGCLLIPANGHAAAEAGDESSAAESSARGEAPGVTGSPSGVTLQGEEAGSAGPPSAIESDDPVRAASALLDRRRECLRTDEPRCLDAVDQWNAPALLADQEIARATAPSDDPLASITGVELVERIGATALLRGTIEGASPPETTKPVSLLVMRGETGWRLRSYRVGRGPD